VHRESNIRHRFEQIKAGKFHSRRNRSARLSGTQGRPPLTTAGRNPL
jgi:hypothetical protein